MLNQETLLLAQVGFTLLTTAVLAWVALNADSLREQRLWALGNAATCLGLAVGALTGFSPLIHAVLSYGIMGLGLALILRGLLVFCKKDLAAVWIAVITLLSLALPGYYTLVEPSLHMRLIVTGIYFSLLNGVCAAALVRYSVDRGIAVCVFGFVALGLSLLLRSGYLLTHPLQSEDIDNAVINIDLFVVSLAQVCIVFGMILMVLRRYAERLRQLSCLDPLTGTLNRTELEVQGQRIMHKARQGHRSVSVIMIDADNFKHINDTYGHTAGDEVLRQLSKLLTAQMRPTDLLARYGGEEFVLVFDGLDLTAAMQVSERLRLMLAQQSVLIDGHVIRYTVSMGVASSDEHGFHLARLIAASDTAMYAAKRGGRNRVNAS